MDQEAVTTEPTQFLLQYRGNLLNNFDKRPVKTKKILTLDDSKRVKLTMRLTYQPQVLLIIQIMQ